MNLREAFKLSEAEERVARHLLLGTKAKIIAQQTDRSIGTIRTQIRAVLHKAGVGRTPEFIRKVAVADGWNVRQYLDDPPKLSR